MPQRSLGFLGAVRLRIGFVDAAHDIEAVNGEELAHGKKIDLVGMGVIVTMDRHTSALIAVSPHLIPKTTQKELQQEHCVFIQLL